MKKDKMALGLLMGMAFTAMTGCAVPKIYLNDNQVDTFVKEKFPGSQYVSQVASTKEDTNKTYTYEDEYGRQFFLTTTLDHADDLSGRKIDWMYRRGIDYTYERDIFDAELPDIENYLKSEEIAYEVKEQLYSSHLYLYMDDTEEDTLKHMAKVYATIDNTYLRYNMEEAYVEDFREDNLGSFFIAVVCHDADGNKIQMSKACGLDISRDPAKRMTEKEIYEFMKNELDEINNNTCTNNGCYY